MNFETKKSFLMKLIISVFLIIFLFDTLSVNYSYGWNAEGILFKPFAILGGEILVSINALIATVLSGVNGAATAIINIREQTSVALADGTMLTDIDWWSLLASPERIFQGAYPILDANIFSADTANTLPQSIIINTINGAGSNIISGLKKAVSGIYYSLLGICGVALLCLLIYTGIRIVLASHSPQEQGRWKMYLTDWVKAVCLLLFSHVIMIATFYIVESVMEGFNGMLGDRTINSLAASKCMGLFNGSWDFGEEFIWLIMFGYSTYLTIVFAVAYFKRLAWTTVLIVIAPIIAVIYPLSGRVYNGKEVFSRWLREFIINAAIPVFHTIVYTILIYLPLNLSGSQGTGGLGYSFTDLYTILYCLIAMSMIRPAEKFLRGLLEMNGQIANQASFESGKRTMDKRVEAGMKVATASLQLGTIAAKAVATEGASLGPDLASLTSNEAEKSKGDKNAEILDSETVNSEGEESNNPLIDGKPGSETTWTENDSGADMEGKEDIRRSSNTANIGEDRGIETADLEEFYSDDNNKGKISKWKSTLGRAIGMSALPELQSGIMNIREALHGITDTFYVDGPSGDWQEGLMGRVLPQMNKERMNSAIEQHVTNEYNIQWMIDKHDLLEKNKRIYRYADGTPNEEKAMKYAKEEAKALLQKTAPYLGYGISDLNTMDKLYSYQKKTGCSPAEAIKNYPSYINERRKLSENIRKYVIAHNENINVGVNSKGIPVNIKGGDISTRRDFSSKELDAINKHIDERVESATVYMRNGYRPDVSIELAGLEKRMQNYDKKIKIEKGEVGKDVVTKVYGVIEKAIKENKSEITISNPGGNQNISNLQDFVNSEIRNRGNR